ncbi:MAG TPA: hypothetical protein ENJ08_12245, partial [Gammaproteobacteria bacterium]|nr:hypothetical protein [Gammaproteobacteria bacterium]
MAVECVKQRILLVEESATLRYILVKALKKQDYDILALGAFDEASEALEHPDTAFDALVIGWPNYDQHKEIGRLMSMMDEEERVSKPVLVLSRDADIDVLNWMSRRRYTALVPWENYQDAVDTLKKLLGPETLHENKHPENPRENPRENPIRILFVDDSVSIRHYYQRL